MSNLYDKVEKVINASDMDVAEELLYGRDGIQINSKEYYEKIISNFVKKKEQVLPKINDNIVFDLDENVKDIWDIIFISQYIQEQWIKQRKEIKKEIEKIKQNLKKETNQTKKIELINNRNKLLNSVNKINEYFQDLEKVKELNKINLETSKNINNVKYQKELYELKKAIRIIQKIRNSFEHRDERINIDKIIEIDNEKNRFKISIPSEYLDGFAKGRIIIKEEDKYIIKGVNDIVYPLLKELEYDPKMIGPVNVKK